MEPVTNDQYNAWIVDSPFTKEKAKVTYTSNMKRICQLLGDPNIHDVLLQPSKHGARLIQLYEQGDLTDEVCKTLHTTILAYLKHSELKYKITHDLFEQWYRSYKQARKPVAHRLFNHIPSERQKASHVEWPAILQLTSKLAPGSKEHLLLSLLTLLPPRRQLDWFRVRVYTQANYKPPADHNYVNLGWPKPYILLVDYKTSNAYGNWYKAIPSNLMHVIQTSINAHPRDWLFVDRYDTPYDDVKTFTMWSNRVLKRLCQKEDVSMNTLRHSYISYVHQTTPCMTLKQISGLSRDMGHNISQNMAYVFNKDKLSGN